MYKVLELFKRIYLKYYLFYFTANFCSVIFIIGALNYRSPLIAGYRYYLFSALLILSVGHLGIMSLCYYRKCFFKGCLGIISLLLAAIPLFILVEKQVYFERVKDQVLANDSEEIRELGKHFIIGFRDFNDVEKLIENQSISGIYLTKRNF